MYFSCCIRTILSSLGSKVKFCWIGIVTLITSTSLPFIELVPFGYWLTHCRQNILNRYVEQLVASAEAAVEEVIRRGVSFFRFFFKIFLM